MSREVRATARMASRALVAFAAAAAFGTAHGAAFDLCVRGSSLEEARTAHLQLDATGADISSFAPRLGAILANRRFWDGRAEDLYGAPFDKDLCGDDVAPTLQLHIAVAAEEVRALEAEVAHAAGSEALPVLDRILAAATPPRPTVTRTRDFTDTTAEVGQPVLDSSGRLRYHVMRVYYATDRKATGTQAPDEHFGGDRGALTLGVVNVALPRTHEVGQLEAPSILRLEFSADPDKHVMLQSLTPMSTTAWRAEVAKHATELGNPGILVFVHGYNSTFSDAARRAGQLAFDLRFAGSTVLFSWPSRGETLEYTVDEQAAEWSVPDMRDLLTSLATLAPNTPIYVIAHSMGNRVLTRGFKEMLASDPSRRAPFKQIVLAAPDIDADVFRREIAPAILGKGPRFTLYASSNDKALAASEGVHGGYLRLGESGKDLVVLPGLDTVDASNVSTEFLGHSYFGDSGTVMSDLKYVIRKSLPPEQREQFVLERVKNAAIGLYWRFRSH